ncbi:MAG: hypothetical protein IKU10_00425 [Clostridia bacterium]|nr:hypothetical protein [Clostridia bacterium]
MQPKKTPVLFRMIKGAIRICYRKYSLHGLENLPNEACVVVANHSQLHGPLASELYFPERRMTWCAGQMMHLKDVPAYAFQDFWSQKPKWSQPYYKLCSYLIAPLSAFLFTHADTIGVYHDARILSTFKKTVAALQQGINVIIFPEHDVKHNHIVYELQDRFINVAKHYHRKTGKRLQFVPMYIAPNLNQMVLGKPVVFDPEKPMDDERLRICTELQDRITELGEGLPLHTVVPYRNIPKKQYPKNRMEEKQ